MADWPLIGGQRWEAQAPTSASRGVAAVSGGTANTKGVWSEAITSTSFDSQAMLLNIITGAAGPKDWLMDIGIGSAGNEVILVPNLLVSSVGTVALWPLLLPIGVLAGTRVAARVQGTTLTSQVDVLICLMGQSFVASQPLSRVTDYGTNTATSGGTEVDPGGTTNTKGAWSQLTASTTNPMKNMVIGIGNQNNANRLSMNSLIDIGVGAAGSEVVVFSNLEVRMTTPPTTGTTTAHTPMFSPTLPISIPAGVRLAARSQCSISTDTNKERRLDVVVYGID